MESSSSKTHSTKSGTLSGSQKIQHYKVHRPYGSVVQDGRRLAVNAQKLEEITTLK